MHSRVFKKRTEISKLTKYKRKLNSKEASMYHLGYTEGQFLSLDLNN